MLICLLVAGGVVTAAGVLNGMSQSEPARQRMRAYQADLSRWDDEMGRRCAVLVRRVRRWSTEVAQRVRESRSPRPAAAGRRDLESSSSHS